jgi:hypothetical protein
VAARRLVVVMLVLLGISTLVAAFLPPPDNPSPADRRQPQPNAKQRQAERPPPSTRTGMLLVARMPVSGRPKAVRIERGDELRLTVTAPFGADIEIPGFGLTSPVTPYAGAYFDIFASDRGNFPVIVVDSGRIVGRVLVGRPASGRCGVATPATPQGRASAPQCSPRGRPVSKGHARSARRP